MPRRKKPSNKAILSALAILEEVSKREKQVHVMMIIGPVVLRFTSTIEQQSLSAYTLVSPGLGIDVVPEAYDVIMFHPDGGLLLSRKDIVVAIDAIEHTSEELLDRYPGASKFIN